MQQNGHPDHIAFDNWQHELKADFYINEKNELVYKNAELKKDIKVGLFKPEELDKVVPICIDNYNTIIDNYKKISEKWNNTEDKLSLKNDIQQLRNTALRTPAIGILEDVIQFLHQAENNLQNIYAKNKKIKEEIVEKAKSLSDSTDWKTTTEAFKQLQEDWKNAPEISKVDHDNLTAQYNEYKNSFFNKRNEILETEHMLNWDKKIEICEKAESIQHSEDWRKTSDELQALFEEWKTIGNVTSIEKNEELWNRFNAARQAFFDRKNAHSETIKSEQSDNYNKKITIVEEAEALSNSTEWKDTQKKFEHLQAQWDLIGKVPQEFSDDIWNRWRKAKEIFYEAKKKFNKEFIASLNENYEKKKAITEKAEKLSQSNQWRQTTEDLSKLLDEWKSIGHIPREYGDELWNRFNEARRLFFQRKDEDREIRKKQFAEKAQSRISQTEKFITVLKKELEDDEMQLAEFRNNIDNTDGSSKKDIELKEHLTHLISKLEKQIEKRIVKIEDVQKQLEELKKSE